MFVGRCDGDRSCVGCEQDGSGGREVGRSIGATASLGVWWDRVYEHTGHDRSVRESQAVARSSCGEARHKNSRTDDSDRLVPQVGSLDKKDINVGSGLVGAPACGDGACCCLWSSRPDR